MGKGGDEDVNVVARRVGLNRQEDACGIRVNNGTGLSEYLSHFTLPDKPVVPEVL